MMLETLLHEFGHSVHNNLSTTRYSSQGGTNVLRDFVEAPSQMLEDWVYDRSMLDVMREVCPACKPVPDDLLAQARAAKRYGKGVRYARQALYAAFDLGMHDAEAPEPMALWARMEGATPLGLCARHACSRRDSAMSPAATAPATTATYGARWWRPICAPHSAAIDSTPSVGARYRDTVLANGSAGATAGTGARFPGSRKQRQAFFEDLQR